MKRKSSSLLRIILILAPLTAAGYYFYHARSGNLPFPIQFSEERVKGLTTSLNIDTDKLIDTATKKLVDPPQIMDQAQDIAIDSGLLPQDSSFQQITNKMLETIKDLPKEQAKTIIKQTCQEVIENIDNSY